MAAQMTKPFLKKLCKDTGLYGTPSVNDKLYLHYKGFRNIENLEEYTGVKALWLEGNGLPKIEGLQNMTLLRSLYIHENMIETIEGLDATVDLDTINLSKNFIKKIENLSQCTKLSTLNLSFNGLTTAESIEHILDIPSLQTLDIQSNKIDDPDVLDLFSRMPDLRVLYLMGNPVVKKIPHYRKTIIAKCQHLKYLDDRPVFEEERRRVNAWAAALETGGLEAAQEAERQELKNIRQEKDDADERNFRAFEQMIRQGQAIRTQREAQEVRDGTFFPRPGASEFNPFSGEQIVNVPESDSLRLAREARWGTGVATGAEDLIGVVEDNGSDTDSNPAMTTSGSDTDSTGADTFTNHIYDANAGSDTESSASSYGLEDEQDFASHLAATANMPPPVPAPEAVAAAAVNTGGWTSINIIEEDGDAMPAATETVDMMAPPPMPVPFYGDVSPPDVPAETSTDLCELD